jgi:hypothetical protein
MEIHQILVFNLARKQNGWLEEYSLRIVLFSFSMEPENIKQYRGKGSLSSCAESPQNAYISCTVSTIELVLSLMHFHSQPSPPPPGKPGERGVFLNIFNVDVISEEAKSTKYYLPP